MKIEHSDKYVRLGLRIAYFRKIAGYTQEQLAEKVGISTTFIGQIEAPNIVKALSLDTLFTIADFLQVPVKRFFEYDMD